RREIVARRPDARGEFFAEQIVLAGKPLEGDIAVAVELVAQDVEIAGPDRDRQVVAPPVLDTLVFDEAPGLEPADLVLPGAERRLERGLLEIMRRIVGTREDR